MCFNDGSGYQLGEKPLKEQNLLCMFPKRQGDKQFIAHIFFVEYIYDQADALKSEKGNADRKWHGQQKFSNRVGRREETPRDQRSVFEKNQNEQIDYDAGYRVPLFKPGISINNQITGNNIY